MVRLVARDLLDTVADPVGEAGTHEVFLRELAKGLLVEGVLEVLEGHWKVSQEKQRRTQSHLQAYWRISVSLMARLVGAA